MNAKSFEMQQRWRELEKRRRILEIDEAKLCFDTRAMFPEGKAGDEACHRWLENEMGFTFAKREECLRMAAAYRLVPDKKTWEDVGGYKSNLSLIVDKPKREQVQILETAKAEARSIRGVVQAIERKQEFLTGSPSKESSIAQPTRLQSVAWDLEILAEYVLGLPSWVPDKIKESSRAARQEAVATVTPDEIAQWSPAQAKWRDSDSHADRLRSELAELNRLITVSRGCGDVLGEMSLRNRRAEVWAELEEVS